MRRSAALPCPSAEYQPGGSRATGDPTLTYQWQKDGVDLPSETNPTLTLTNLEERDAGVYTLIASSLGEALSSADITLTFNPFTSVEQNRRLY